MEEQRSKDTEGVVSEAEGCYTTNIRATELRDNILLRIVLLILVWPVLILVSLALIFIFPEEYQTVTIPVFFSSFLWIIPIAVIVRKMAKSYHKGIVYVNKTVCFKVMQEAVYMDEVKVKIVIDYLEENECFKIYTSRFNGYVLDIRDTEEFRCFLEDNRIPYV